MIFRRFLFVVETRDESVGRVSVRSALLLWQAFGVNGHKFVDVRNRVGLVEQFVNSSRVNLKEADLLNGLVG